MPTGVASIFDFHWEAFAGHAHPSKSTAESSNIPNYTLDSPGGLPHGQWPCQKILKMGVNPDSNFRAKADVKNQPADRQRSAGGMLTGVASIFDFHWEAFAGHAHPSKSTAESSNIPNYTLDSPPGAAPRPVAL